jgi:radical SAM superfamily enzyme YgiQ (UPF0313 family)
MKSSIILVYPKIEFEKNYPCSWLPYSILAIASMFDKISNINILLYDQNISKNEDDFNEMLMENIETLLCVGFSIMTGGGQIKNALHLAILVKEQRIKTVFGGPHVNVLPEETLDNSLVDAVLYGPGQFSFPSFVDALKGNLEYKDVSGLIIKQGNERIYGTVNYPKERMLPPYCFDFINLEQYIQKDNTIANRTVNYISTQGCAYSCRFCYETNYRRAYYKLSPNTVIADIDFFSTEYDINGIKFYDADWFIDGDRANTLIEYLCVHKIKWAASIHPNDILQGIRRNPDFLKNLKKSGCKRLLMGIESGCDRVLSEIINKRTVKSDILTVTKKIAENGILGSYTFIVGFPGETEIEQQETFSLIEELWHMKPRPETRVHIYTPYPGTPLYQDAIKHGFVPPDNLEDWSDFDYYKVRTPWTDESLEHKVADYTAMITKM